MKKIFISAILVLAVAVSSFASETNKVGVSVLNNFKSEFKKAESVEWTIGDSYSKATFVLNNVRTEALYTPEGVLIGTSQAVSLESLPTNAKRAFAKKYGSYTVKEAIRFEGSEESAYYISAENETKSVVLKVEDNGFMTTLHK